MTIIDEALEELHKMAVLQNQASKHFERAMALLKGEKPTEGRPAQGTGEAEGEPKSLLGGE